MRGMMAASGAAALALFLIGCGSSTQPSTIDGGADADTDAIVTTGPIDAPPDTWTWVDFPDSRCASGVPTGIGVNPHPGATRTLIFFQGGGACFDADSCWITMTAQHLAGGNRFGGEQAQLAILLRRSNNPLRDANMVYVPYCTGDLHSGNAMVTFDVNGTPTSTYFWGGKNMDLFLTRLVPTFPNQTRIILTGESAGGYGSFANVDRVQRAFGVRVDAIDDSGPPSDDPHQVATVMMGGTSPIAVWGSIWPADCASRKLFSDIYDCNRKAHPESRFGFLSFRQDTSISKSYGLSLAEYATLLDTLETSKIGPDPNAASLVVDNRPAHVVMEFSDLDTYVVPWIDKMVNDDPSWTSELH